MADSVWINQIQIEGNKRTKDWIILRELSFKQGDRISSNQLDSLLTIEANKVFNTDLFIISDIKYQQENYDHIQIKIKVIEKWYLYIIPIVDVADRNFNEWLKDRDRDLNRLKYGINFKQKNFRGRNESLSFGFKWGFNREVSAGYEIPYVDKKRTLGVSTSIKYITNNGLAYRTEENKLAFHSDDNTNRKRLDLTLSIGKRTGFYSSHSLKTVYRSHSVSDSVTILNPNYFLDGRNRSRMFELSYRFSHDFRDMRAYPLKGHLLEIDFIKKGVGIFQDINVWEAKLHYSKFHKLSERLFIANTFRSKLSTTAQQPYGFLRGLGYSQEFVRGYDLYVVDAQQFILNRNTFRWMIFDKILKIDKIMPLDQFNTVPLKIFAKAFFDGAYSKNRFVSHETNTLDNRWLYGGGVGIDFVTFYNSTIRLEYSLNGRGETGLFFYYGADL